MKKLVYALSLVAALLLAIFIAPMLIGETGYVLIAMGNWTIESTVVTLVGCFIALLIAMYLLIRLYRVSNHSVVKLSSWFSGRTNKATETAFYQGLNALAIGNQQVAATAMEKANHRAFHGFNFVALGQLALQENNIEKAKSQFAQAIEQGDAAASKSATFLLAQYYIYQNDADSALLCLDTYFAKDAKRAKDDPDILKVRVQAMMLAKQWQQLQDALPKWKKSLGAEHSKWVEQVANNQFAEIASKQGANQLKAHWGSLARSQRNDEAYRAGFVTQLIDQGMHEDVQTYLTQWYKKGGIPTPLLLQLKRLRLPNPAATIRILELEIKASPTQPEPYATLGHIAFFSGDIELSEKALAKAVILHETKPELLLLAKIYEQNKAFELALDAMRKVAKIPTAKH